MGQVDDSLSKKLQGALKVVKPLVSIVSPALRLLIPEKEVWEEFEKSLKFTEKVTEFTADRIIERELDDTGAVTITLIHSESIGLEGSELRQLKGLLDSLDPQ